MQKKNILLIAAIAVFYPSYSQDEVQDSLKVIDVTEVSEKTDTKATAAQQDFLYSHFRLVYIDHEPTTPVTTIHQRLEKLYEDATESGSPLIIYLADEDQPIISFTNLKDPSPDRKRNNEEAYANLIKQMYIQPTHEVRANTDLDSLKGLIGPEGVYPLFNDQGGQSKMNFKSITLDFYIGPHFWNLRYNEDLIAQLFVNLKMDQRLNTKEFPPTKLAFNVLKPRGTQLYFPSGEPFGRKDLGGISKKIEIKEY